MSDDLSICAEIAPLLVARPLGVLEPEEEARVAEHLALCKECPEVAKSFESALAAAVPAPRKAPEAAWEKLHARIERDQATPEKADDVKVVLSCSYCHASLVKREAVYCASCLAPHHSDCFAEHGKCSAPGCGETQTVTPRTMPAMPAQPASRGVWRELAPLAAVLFVAISTAALTVVIRWSNGPEDFSAPPRPPKPLAPPAPPPTPGPPPGEPSPRSGPPTFQADAPIDSGFAWDSRRLAFLGVGRDGVIYDLDAHGKRTPWSAARKVFTLFRERASIEGAVGEFGDVFSEPEIVGDHAYIGTTGGVIVLDLASRRVEAGYSIDQGAVVARPLVLPSSGRIVCGTTSGEIVGFAPPRTQPAWRHVIEGPLRQPGVTIDDTGRYVAFGGADGLLRVLESETGASPYQPIEVGQLAASPVRVRDRIYLATKAGEIVSLHFPKGDGTVWSRHRWRDPDGRQGAFTVGTSGLVLVANDAGSIRCLEGETLRQIWELLPTGGAEGGRPQVAVLNSGGPGIDRVLFVWPNGRGRVVHCHLSGPFERYDLTLAPGKLSVSPERLVLADDSARLRFFDHP